MAPFDPISYMDLPEDGNLTDGTELRLGENTNFWLECQDFAVSEPE